MLRGCRETSLPKSRSLDSCDTLRIGIPNNGSPTASHRSRRPDSDSEVGSVFARVATVHRNAQSVSRSTPPARPLVATRTRVASALAPLVLIADGDAVSRDIREAQLRAAGLRVSVARTGFEAIVKASCQMPQVILLDDSLTGIEAADTLRMLRICPTTAHILVVRLLRGRRLPQRMLSRLRRVAA